MCSGSTDGSIRVWSLDTLEEERALLIEGAAGVVFALAVWAGQLISGHDSGRVRVWDVRTGERRRALEGHAEGVRSLCTVGARLASGSDDGSIKVWAMGDGAEWPCERTLAGGSGVGSLARWEGRLISGSWDGPIRVWELETGGLDATLTGHRGGVCGLLVHGGRLFSASEDGSVRAWAVGTWAAVASVDAYDVGASGQYPRCLAASGPKLVSGSQSYLDDSRCELRVWDTDSLACEQTVRQPAGADVQCLAAAGGEVWGGLGMEGVVGGRE